MDSILSVVGCLTPLSLLPWDGTVSHLIHLRKIALIQPDVLQWAVVLPLELVVAGQVIQYWDTGVPLAAWITIFLVLVLVSRISSLKYFHNNSDFQILSVFGTLGYAEEEFWVSMLKLIVIIIVIITGIICICGGGPAGGANTTYLGARHFYDPGAFANGFKGVCSVSLFADVGPNT